MYQELLEDPTIYYENSLVKSRCNIILLISIPLSRADTDMAKMKSFENLQSYVPRKDIYFLNIRNGPSE